jgi:glycosyltransferase 2 family protein
MTGRALRVLATLVVTALGTLYVLTRADLGETIRLLTDAHAGYVAAAVALVFVTVLPMAWRWQRLLVAKGIRDRLSWLVRAYFVAYTAGQILPTAVGGDAIRIFETARRHPNAAGVIAGSVLLERAVGAAATLVLAAVGFVLAYGTYDVGAYLWLELGLVVVVALGGVLMFSRTARPVLGRGRPLLRRLRLERPVRSVYEGIHAYRENVALLVGVFALTIAVQAVRILSIWLTGKSVGVELSPRAYYVMGPLLFLVMLVPFTINGLAIRESFFVSFLTTLGVGADPALATGLLFFVITLALAVPGLAIVAVESIRGARPRVRPET